MAVKDFSFGEPVLDALQTSLSPERFATCLAATQTAFFAPPLDDQTTQQLLAAVLIRSAKGRPAPTAAQCAGL